MWGTLAAVRDRHTLFSPRSVRVTQNGNAGEGGGGAFMSSSGPSVWGRPQLAGPKGGARVGRQIRDKGPARHRGAALGMPTDRDAPLRGRSPRLVGPAWAQPRRLGWQLPSGCGGGLSGLSIGPPHHIPPPGLLLQGPMRRPPDGRDAEVGTLG